MLVAIAFAMTVSNKQVDCLSHLFKFVNFCYPFCTQMSPLRAFLAAMQSVKRFILYLASKILVAKLPAKKKRMTLERAV